MYDARIYETKSSQKRAFALARRAIDKALKYNSSSAYMRQAVRIYRDQGDTKGARALLAHVLSLYPDNLELLQLQAEMDA